MTENLKKSPQKGLDPETWVAWANRLAKPHLPDDLNNAVKNRQGLQRIDSPVVERERKSLLLIIAALAGSAPPGDRRSGVHGGLLPPRRHRRPARCRRRPLYRPDKDLRGDFGVRGGLADA